MTGSSFAGYATPAAHCTTVDGREPHIPSKGGMRYYIDCQRREPASVILGTYIRVRMRGREPHIPCWGNPSIECATAPTIAMTLLGYPKGCSAVRIHTRGEGYAHHAYH